VIAEGDSIAYGLAKYNHLQGNPVGGRNPEAVFKNIESNLKMDPDYYRDSTVVLSPGIMNTNDKNRDAMLKFVPWQIQAIKNAGGNVVLTGVDKGSWKQFNPYLKQLADQTGATFGGELPTTDVHPSPDGYKSYYGNNKLPYGGAPPQPGTPTERSGYLKVLDDQPASLDRNVPGPYGATGYGLGHVAPKSERIAYIEQAAKAAGLNPYALLMTTATEGLHAYVGDQNDPAGKSYGDFQLNEGGMGRTARAAGINISDPNTWRQQVDFVVQQMAAHRGDSRWFASQWHGPRDNAPWAVANFSNPDAQPPQGFSLAGGGQRFGGRTGVGRGGGFGGAVSSGGGGDGSALQSFQGRVENKDHVGFLTDVASTPTAPGFDGWMARWMTLQNRVVMDAIVNGHADQVEHIEDAFTRMGYQGMNSNLMNMYQSLQRGDTQAAARYGSLAYSYFPDGAHVKFQTNPQGRLFAQQIGEASGQPIGGPMEVTPDKILAQMRFTNNPQKFQEFLAKQQAATVKAQLDKAKAGYWEGLLDARKQMNDNNNKATITRALVTERGAMDRTIYNNANKPETGQLTLEQMSKEQKDLMTSYTDPVTGGKVGGFDINTPEGQQKLALVPALGRSIMANSKGRLLATDVKPIIDGIVSGKFKPRATTNPQLIAILDEAGNNVAAIDIDTAKRFGLAPASPQAGAPAQQPALGP
jgi:hypothetical protein